MPAKRKESIHAKRITLSSGISFFRKNPRNPMKIHNVRWFRFRASIQFDGAEMQRKIWRNYLRISARAKAIFVNRLIKFDQTYAREETNRNVPLNWQSFRQYRALMMCLRFCYSQTQTFVLCAATAGARTFCTHLHQQLQIIAVCRRSRKCVFKLFTVPGLATAAL